MTTSQALVTRYTELVEAGQLELAFNYLSADVIYNSWLGIAEGRDNVINFMKDNIRFIHHTRSFGRWKQVQHSLEPVVLAAFAAGRAFDSDGYDAQSYATFERDGRIASHAKFHAYTIPIKETIVVKSNSIALIQHSKRL